MDKIIQDKKTELEKLCKQFHTERLEVFGSASRDDFDPSTSDVDFLVEFDETGVKKLRRLLFRIARSTPIPV